MELKTLRNLIFAGFITIVAYNIITGIVSYVVGLTGNSEVISLSTIIITGIRTVIDVGLVTVMIMYFTGLKWIENIDKEKQFVLISMIAMIICVFFKICIGVYTVLITKEISVVLDNTVIFALLTGIAAVISFFIFATFVASIVLFILSWFLYGKKREAGQ